MPSHNQITKNERAVEKACNLSTLDAIKLNCFPLHDAKPITKLISNNIWLRAWTQGS